VLALVVAAAPVAPPEMLAVEVLGREAPRQVQLSRAASVTCDGQGSVPAGAVHLSWTHGAVVLGGPGVGTRRCKKVQLGPPVEGSVPGAVPAGEAPCGTRAGLVIAAGPLRRCLEGTLQVAAGARALRLVLRLPLEAYVASVVASEAGDAPPEAQAAQAVVTRTWALVHLGRHGDADACDLTHCQLFRGEWTEGSGRAAARTEGQVLMRGDTLLPAFFHAACGGHTATSQEVFGEPGLGAVPDGGPGGKAWCAEPAWGFTVPRARLARALGLGGGGSVRVVDRTPDGRVREVEAFGRRLPGPLFVARVGRALGFGTLRSTRFRVESDGTRLHFRGEGRGHGVGLCQAGASARARAGQRWVQLLEAYFPGAEVARAGRAISPPP
jgi:stage II sporulation protein D